jgi:hypothetical protein
MARPKSVTIKLTDKQRSQIKRLTGEEHGEVKFERSALSSKAPPKRFVPRRDMLPMKKAAQLRPLKKAAGLRPLKKAAGLRPLKRSIPLK